MKTSDKLKILKACILARLIKKKTPLVISWVITKRCNYSCLYCNEYQQHDSSDLDTKNVLLIIKKLASLGTKVMLFTGGEPLFRDDIGTIIDYCTKMDMITGINSNGSLVADKISDISNVDMLTLSLDGPQKIHDVVRSKGSFGDVMTASRIASENNIKVKFLTVLSKYNLEYSVIDYLINIAESLNTTVTFQPATYTLLRGEGKNPVFPAKERYRKIIDYLMEKKRTSKNIGNSFTGLRHMRAWPEPLRIRCAGELLYRRIDNTGNVSLCGVCVSKKINNCLSKDFKEAILESKPTHCDQCWCATRVELNYAFSGNLNAFYGIAHNIFKV